MLATYAKEFVGIGKFLLQSGAGNGRYILVNKEKLQELMDKNPYDSVYHKLKIWKDLKWMVTDGRHLSYPVAAGNGKVKRMIKIDIGVYECLEGLLKNQK